MSKQTLVIHVSHNTVCHLQTEQTHLLGGHPEGNKAPNLVSHAPVCNFCCTVSQLTPGGIHPLSLSDSTCKLGRVTPTLQGCGVKEVSGSWGGRRLSYGLSHGGTERRLELGTLGPFSSHSSDTPVLGSQTYSCSVH